MARERPWLIGLLVAAGLAVALQVPVMLSEASKAWSIAQHWPDHEQQYRMVVEDVPYDLLAAAEDSLPRGATVLLVTSGADVRIREYATFHRALYFLAPRPVYWITPTPSDGTWESRWWRSVPDVASSTCAEAARVGATHLLLVDVPPPEPPCRGIIWEYEFEDGWIVATPQRPGRPVGVPASTASGPPAWWLVAGTIAALAVPLAIGWALVSFLTRGAGLHVGQRAAAAWAVGAGVVTLADTLLGVAGAPPAVRLGLLAAAAIAAMAVTLRREVPRLRRPAKSLIPVAVLAPLVGLVTLLSVGVPLSTWDGWAIWGTKARTLFVEGRLTESVFADPTRASIHPGYPLNVPTLEAWLFNWIGTPDDRIVGVLSVAAYVALLAVVYGTLRRAGLERWFATGAVLVLGSLYYLWRTAADGFADVPLALLATVTAVLLVEWLRTGHRGVLALGAIAAGLMPWTKMEGAILLAVLAAAALAAGALKRDSVARRRGRVGAAAFVLAGLALSGWWWALMAFSGSPSAVYELSLGTFVANLGRIPVIAAMQAQLLVGLNWSFLWLAAAIVTAAWVVRRRGSPTLILLLPVSAVAYLVAMSAAYVVTSYEPYTAQIQSSAFRLALQVLPLVVIWTAVALRDLLPRQQPANPQ